MACAYQDYTFFMLLCRSVQLRVWFIAFPGIESERVYIVILIYLGFLETFSQHVGKSPRFCKDNFAEKR